MPIASLTNRKIVGKLIKQKWGGHRDQHAIDIGEEMFDATAVVLQMDYADLLKVTDHSVESDAIAQKVVEWDGPFEVEIEESILEFFGVTSINDFTQSLYEYVKAHAVYFVERVVNPTSESYVDVDYVDVETFIRDGHSDWKFTLTLDRERNVIYDSGHQYSKSQDDGFDEVSHLPSDFVLHHYKPYRDIAYSILEEIKVAPKLQVSSTKKATSNQQLTELLSDIARGVALNPDSLKTLCPTTVNALKGIESKLVESKKVIKSLLDDVVPHTRDTGHNVADREMSSSIQQARKFVSIN